MTSVPAPPAPPAPLLSEKEVAEVLGVTPSALRKARCTGALDLPFVKVGGRVRYSIEAVRAFIERHTKQGTKR